MDPRPVRGVLALHSEQMPHTANPATGLWRQGEGIAIPWSRKKIAQIAQSTLRLEPTPFD